MLFAEMIELIVCMLAVYGVYALICRLLAHGCYKGDLSVGLRVRRGTDLSYAALSDGVRRARILTEGQAGKMRPPVILLTECDPSSADEETADLLRTCEVYYRMK